MRSTDVRISVRCNLEIFSGNGLEYDSHNIDYYSSSRECFLIDGDNPADDAPELTSQDQSPRSRADYLQEKVACL